MARDFISELEYELSFKDPSQYVVQAAIRKLRDWEKYYEEMHKDKGSDLWSEPFFVCVYKEYKNIRTLLKRKKLI